MKNLPQAFDNFQYKRRWLAFVVAVIKRYGENQDGRNAALLTYYLFLSLFPLLFWLSLLANVLNHYFPGTAATLIHAATGYFPVLGNQLDKVAHSSSRSTIGIVVSSLVTLYGARGTAMMFGSTVSRVFAIPKDKLPGFPHNWLRGAWTVLIGGGGFLLTAVGYSWALSHGQAIWFRGIIALVGLAVLGLVFMAILKLSLPKNIKARQLFSVAAVTALTFGMLQFAGGLIVTHSLKHYTDTYTALFATTLGLIAWIYLEAQVLLYSMEVVIVAKRHLWPRRLAAEVPSVNGP